MTVRRTFRLPDPGEGLTEAEIVRWLVQPGERVALDQPIVEIETAKALVELPSPYAGVVEHWHAQTGQSLDVGEPLVTILSDEPDMAGTDVAGGPGEDDPGPQAAVDAGPQGNGTVPKEERPVPTLVGYGSAPVATGTAGGAWASFVGRGTAGGPASDEPTRRLPSGPEDFAGATEVRVPLRGVLGQMAIAMTVSSREAAHASMWRAVDITDVMTQVRGVPGLSPLVLIARALAQSAARHPAINARWSGDGSVVVHRSVGLGIAVASPRGLVVPVVREAERLDAASLSGAIRQLVQRARAGTLTVTDLAGGTITLTNVGSLGAEGASPILKPGEAAILAVGRVARRPWIVEDSDGEQIVPRDIVQLTLTVDHRMVDGHLAATVLGAIVDYLQHHWADDLAALRGDGATGDHSPAT